MKSKMIVFTLLAALLLCGCARQQEAAAAPAAPTMAAVPVAEPLNHEAAQPTVSAATAASGLAAVLRGRGITLEPALSGTFYDRLKPVERLYTDAAITCRYADGTDAGTGTLKLSAAYPAPAFEMTVETAAGTLRLSRAAAADGAASGALHMTLGSRDCDAAPDDLTDIAVARLDGKNDYLLLYDNGPDGDPCILIYRLGRGIDALGAIPNRGLRGDGVSLLSGERLSCFTEDPMLTWYTLDGSGLALHCADPDSLTGRVFTAAFDIYGQLPEITSEYGQNDEWIPSGEQVVIRSFPGSWYNDWQLCRASGFTQHYLLWIGE